MVVGLVGVGEVWMGFGIRGEEGWAERGREEERERRGRGRGGVGMVGVMTDFSQTDFGQFLCLQC